MALTRATGKQITVKNEGTGSVVRNLQDKLNETVSVKDFGAGDEIGALLQAAVDAGYTHITIPDSTTWTWATTLVLPEQWRGRIVSHQSKSVASAINCKTGNNNPCIDAQGALFVELDGINVFADKVGGNEPACFVVFARMLSGASSSNHRVTNCLIDGSWYYCGVYNVGGEELYFENNYYSIAGTTNTVTHQTACVVHSLNEDAYFSGIVTKEARTNGTSTSAITHIGETVKNFNAGGSAIYIGPNVNDVALNLSYGRTAASSYFLSLGGYYDGIRLNAERVEGFKSSPIVYAPNDLTAGSINIIGGSYRREGSVDNTAYAIDIGGTTASSCVITVDKSVKWSSSFGGNVEDIYLLRSTKKTQCDVSFTNGALSEFLTNTEVNITTLLNSKIEMGKSSKLTVASELYGNQYFFYLDNSISANNAATVLKDGLSVADGVRFSNTSSDTTALDFYSEETWTPVVADAETGGNVGSATVSGKLTRIGNVVHASCLVANINTTGMTAGNSLYIRGLPYAAGSGVATGFARCDGVAFTGYVSCDITGGATSITLWDNASSSADSPVIVSDITSGTADLFISITYFV